jgi:hypothetical protein
MPDTIQSAVWLQLKQLADVYGTTPLITFLGDYLIKQRSYNVE